MDPVQLRVFCCYNFVPALQFEFSAEFVSRLLIRHANLALITPATAISKPGNFNLPEHLSKLPSPLLNSAVGHSSCRGGIPGNADEFLTCLSCLEQPESERMSRS